MHKNLITIFLAVTAAIPSNAQTLEPDSTKVQWGLSAGINQYIEPDLMRLQGPELGLHVRVKDWAYLPQTQLEGEVLFGKQRYTSNGSGSMTGVSNLETRWRALTPLFADDSDNPGWSAGLAVHTLWNDLRGTTTVGNKTYAGYQRIASQLWLPIRWTSADMWEVDAGLLIYSRHTSQLSEVNAAYQDIVNTQRRGQYAQISMNISLSQGDSLKPFIRYTHLADSNEVAMAGKYWLEPASHRWQAGAVWEFNTP